MKRRKLHKSRSKQIFGFNSIKSGKYFRVESPVEFDACYDLESRQDIASFEAQPTGYEYDNFGKKGKYTPDFGATYTESGKEVRIEVKSDEEAGSRKFKEVFIQKQAFADRLNTPLQLLKASDIRKEPLLSNLKLLYKYQTAEDLNDQHYALLDLISAQGSLQIKDLPDISGIEKMYCYPVVYDLLARGVLVTESPLESTPLNSQAVVRCSHEQIY